MAIEELNDEVWDQICDLYRMPSDTKVSVLGGDENQVFKLSLQNGATRVLRLSLPRRGFQQHLRSEALVLEHVRRNSDVNVPSPVPDRYGQYFATLSYNKDSTPKLVSMFSYVKGEPLSGKELSMEMMLRIGSVLGQLDAALQHADKTIKPSPSGSRVRRDGEKILDWAYNFLTEHSVKWAFLDNHYVMEKGVPKAILAISNRLRVYYGKLQKSLSHQLIHMDAHLDNLLYDGTQIGIIDFHNMALGPRVYELTAPVQGLFHSNFSPVTRTDSDEYSKWTEALLTGYGTTTPLSRMEVNGFSVVQALRLFVELTWAVSRQDSRVWSDWLQQHGARTIEHIVILLDDYKKQVGLKRFFFPLRWKRNPVEV